MTDRHYKERFDDEMAGVHAARRNAGLEEEEWQKIEAKERDFRERWGERKTLVGCFERLKKSLLSLRNEILIGLRLKKKEILVVSMSPEIVKGCMKSMEDIKAGRCRNAQEFIDELDQGESDG